jgi:PAS domain S-box-containing protein
MPGERPEMLHELLERMPAAVFVKDLESRLVYVNGVVERELGAPREELLGRRTSELTTTEAFTRTAELDRRVLETRAPVEAQQETLVDNELVAYQVLKFPLLDADGEPWAIGAIVADVTRRSQLEAGLLRASEVVDIFDQVRDGVVVLTRDWKYAYLNTQAAAMFGRNRDSLLGRHIWTEFPEGVGQPFHLRYEEAMATGEPVTFIDHYAPWDRWFENRVYPSDRGIAIFFHDVTDQRNAAIERERLLANLVSAQEAERSRIAADLHDDAVQALSASLLRLDLLEMALEPNDRATALAEARATVQRSIAALRAAVFDLRPPSLARGGLGRALGDYLDQCRERHGFRCHLDCEIHDELSEERRTVLYRIAAEALTNAGKHAGAEHVSVEVREQDGGVALRVADDGAGFDVGAHDPAPGHIGLDSMRERAELAGGRFEVTSAAGSGTVVSAWIPTRTMDVHARS